MNPSFELRSALAEVRMTERDGKPVIAGYGAVFGKRSETLTTSKGKPFVETVAAGAFSRSLAGGADVRALFNHDPNYPLGRRSAGTLRVFEDAQGLRYEIDPPDTQYARDLMESIRRGDVSGSSFTFATVEDDWQPGEGGVAARELRSVHLFELGPVVFPAYRDTSVAARSLDAFEASREAPAGAADAPAVTYPTPDQIALLHRLRLVRLS